MNDQLSATIIPFPVQKRSVPQTAPAMEAAPAAPAVRAHQPPQATQPAVLSNSSQRLTQALANLTEALADQREATQRWKSAIEDLAAKMRTLGELGTPRTKLG